MTILQIIHIINAKFLCIDVIAFIDFILFLYEYFVCEKESRQGIRGTSLNLHDL